MRKMKIDVRELESRVKAGRIKKFTEGDYVGWCYTQKCQYEKLWDDYTRIARGIVTLPDGTVIARPFPKFYNLGEPETGKIPWHEPIEVTEKIDGSLIVVSFLDGKPIINTKAGFNNEYTDFARSWLQEHMNEWLMRPSICQEDYTYCFEAVFPETNPDNTKIISYGDRADMTLLAEIHRETGKEGTYEDLEAFGEEWGMGIAPRHDFDEIETLIARCRSRKITEGEGVVLRFTESNLRVKVKSQEYLRLNRLISHTSEKHILDALANSDDIESVYSALPDELFGEVQQTATNLHAEYQEIKDRAAKAISEIEQIPIRKVQSLYIMQNPGWSDIKGLLFAMLDGKDTSRGIWDIMRKRRKM